ncbi:MAG: putative toxin-antitoxin system toxin component, PIN family [Candidatus Micrarchaeia archaeon]
MKVVLDTNALISATLWPNSSARKTLLLLRGQEAKFYTSKTILEEYEKAIKRDFPEMVERLPELTGYIATVFALAEPSSRLHVVKEDPEDDKIIECAVAAGAEFIITYDTHLLKLQKYGGIRILTPENMRRLLNQG